MKSESAAVAVEGRMSTRDLLLTAASELMRKRDTLNVPISEIAAEAGVNSALVKYYFGNKNGLMLALLERDLGASITQLSALVNMDMSPSKKMRYHLSGLVRMYFRCPYLQRLLIKTMRDENAETARDIAEKYLSPISRAYQTMISEGVAAGEFKPIDARLFYFIAIGSADQIFSARFVLKYVHGIDEIDDELRRAYVDTTITLIMDGLLAKR
ncbi:TetR family transcriptional regulator [uncultured Albimonas sp.]|uniref:TetR family transcriptional regulator n=1 Tax=uncultured Albimonas sp. TaxID=1331701 RepID=UPI0030ECA8F2|tara:strand:+ start:8302 stop:8940 length:639 start_codon:yes stop_codon:yes gene_type:complete